MKKKILWLLLLLVAILLLIPQQEQEVKTHVGAIVTRNSVLGTVGDTGNAKGKPAHCHWSIFTVFPLFEHWVPSEKRTKTDDLFKMFIVNPIEALEGNQIW